MDSTSIELSSELKPTWRLLLEPEQRLITAALVLVAACAWAFILAGAGMGKKVGLDDPSMVIAPMPWEPSYAVAIFLMWWIMMVAMMLPNATPAILLYDRVARRIENESGRTTLLFTSGYLLIWGAFSLAAVVLHWVLDQSGFLTKDMASASTAVGGLVLLAAGLWQLTPMKHACLVRCQNPLQFLTHGWCRGRLAPVRMGLAHGLDCLGCCWAMMGLLFYGGIINTAWIVGLALYNVLDKSLPAGNLLPGLVGCALIFAGSLVLISLLSF